MDEKKLSQNSKKSILLRMKIACEKRKYICSFLSGALMGALAGNILYFTQKHMSWEMWKIFVTLFFLSSIVLLIFILRWEKRVKNEEGT